MTRTLILEELRDLTTQVLTAAGTSADNAGIVAHALVRAEAEGIASHGVSRVPFYADQVKSGKVDGQARPEAQQTAPAAVRVDAKEGFAFPAIRLGLERSIKLARETGVAGLGISNSHHAGVGGHHVEDAASTGLLALGFTNTPAAMAPWGGHQATFGTNPIAFACPRQNSAPLVIDLSLSKVARGKIMLAEKRGEIIPDNWALDRNGRPTSDPKEALTGTMQPIGEAKGAVLAFMVEILSAALTSSNFAFQASSFFTAEGPPPRIGQFFLLIYPAAFCGSRFSERIEVLISAVLGQRGTRLPGQRRLELREKARREGVAIPEALYEELMRRAGRREGA